MVARSALQAESAIAPIAQSVSRAKFPVFIELSASTYLSDQCLGKNYPYK
jgi:hypothetical protein